MFFLVLLTGALLVFLIALLGYEVHRALQIAINEYFDSFFKDLDDDRSTDEAYESGDQKDRE